MIPKLIHYCWFGKGPLSSIAERCLESWERHAPEFQLMRWDEDNTAKYRNKFYKDAYRKKQYAFVADCVRVQVLKEFGGIYMDLDMLLLKPLNTLLSIDFFTVYEVEARPAYGLFGGVQGHRFFKAMSDYYDSHRYNAYSPPVITHQFKELITTSSLRENERIFPAEVCYALPYEARNENYSPFLTDESLAVHLWDHSWGEDSFSKDFSNRSVAWLIGNIWKVVVDFFVYGYPKEYLKRYTRGFSRILFHRIIGRGR